MPDVVDNTPDLKKIEFGNYILKQRGCKICDNFIGADFYDITMDIVFQRRTRHDIMDTYSSFLPPGVKKISKVNIRRHYRHSAPEAMASFFLQASGKETVDTNIVIEEYNRIFKEKLDINSLMEQLHETRLKERYTLKQMYDERDRRFKKAIDENPDLPYAEFTKMQNSLIDIMVKIDKINESIQRVLNQSKEVRESRSTNTIIFYGSFAAEFKNAVVDLSGDIATYIVGDLMKHDPENARKFAHFFLTTVQYNFGRFFEGSNLKQLVSGRGGR